MTFTPIFWNENLLPFTSVNQIGQHVMIPIYAIYSVNRVPQSLKVYNPKVLRIKLGFASLKLQPLIVEKT
jgi:hypothetical protein